ncbi:hypothetical protein VCJ71_01925 [Alteriqipengyuania sp. WL0013]|uniref:hypothetical protein n=1 Tax=Alteriqipengyuania sp. WL0013 TaxID=3110773 RepID=UPI002C682B67|nr:hypothetical protein [Alteriqipengyuania sp. WL0013]MEB3414817.1 hypothetical protein [Alteriqipengyuania sp. WL0013]
MMSKDVLNFLPLAGIFIGLAIAFAFDPTTERVAWWIIPAGLLGGYAMKFGLKRYYDAR